MPNGEVVAVTASFGVCSWIAAGRDTDRLFKLADQALYVAKREGNCVRVWSDAMGGANPNV